MFYELNYDELLELTVQKFHNQKYKCIYINESNTISQAIIRDEFKKRNIANVSSTQIKYTLDNYELFEGFIVNSYSLQLLSNHYWRTNNIRSSQMTEEQE